MVKLLELPRGNAVASPPVAADQRWILRGAPREVHTFRDDGYCDCFFWELRKEDIGKAARGPFSPDPLLPSGFAKVTSHVYDGSGFDRGHQCPAKDRSATQKDCDATFHMTNVVPQSPNSNQRGWEKLESYCRDLVLKEGRTLYIVCGPAGVGGEGKNGRAETVGKGRVEVTVPANVWKAVLVLPSATAEPRRNTRLIAIIMPNDQSVGQDW